MKNLKDEAENGTRFIKMISSVLTIPVNMVKL